MSELKAWSNYYEVVAAESAEHAHEVLAKAVADGVIDYEIEELDGDGWHVLADDHRFDDEDVVVGGKMQPMAKTVGELVSEGPGGARWLLSLEP